MNYKKDLPKLIIAFICLVALMMYIEVKGSEIIPTLLGFAFGGLLIFVLAKKVFKKK
ncbi:MAG TPA: hypothetical protein VFC40_03235 [Syntrophomonas sp.]|jgi:uncharacterized membrane protein YccC|nr:hypothetical protein [Syntrophomonas sp.]